MKLQYADYSPFQIENGKITVLLTDNVIIYQDLIKAFNAGEDEHLKVISDDFKTLELRTAFDWDGDIFLNANFFKKYTLSLSKQIINNLTDTQRQEITRKAVDINNLLQDILYMTDLPLTVNYDGDIGKLLKVFNLAYDGIVEKSAYDKIIADLNLHQEIQRQKVICLTNIHHYLEDDEIASLEKLVQEKEMSLFLIEFAGLETKRKFRNSYNHYIDQDYVQW